MSSVKNWIDRDGQNADINHEIKDWKTINALHYGVREMVNTNPGFDGDIAPIELLGSILIRLDGWRGSSDGKLDLVGKTDVIDIRKGDKIKYVDKDTETNVELVVNDVEIFDTTIQLGLKYA